MKQYLKHYFLLFTASVIILSCAKEHIVEPIKLSNYKRPTTTNNSGGNNNNNGNDTTTQVHNCNPDTVYFENDVLPLLQSKCLSCHNNGNPTEDVSFTNYTSIINSHELVEPGDVDESELYEAITETDVDDRMPPPPASALTTAQKDLIKKWIEQGAKNNKCTP